MKKFLIVLIVFLIVLSGVKTSSEFSLLDYFSGEYTVYTSNQNKNSIDLGFCYMSTEVNVDGVVGESMVVKNLEVSKALKDLNARVVKSEYLENGTTVIYAYSHLIDDKVTIENNYVNLQIAITGEHAVVGWPLILGSY